MNHAFSDQSQLGPRPIQLPLITAIILATVTVGGPRASSAQEHRSQERDIYCGPRAVEYLIRHFNQTSPPLRETILALEIDLERGGTDLLKMSGVLRSHGITTEAIEIDEDTMIESASPAIIHLKPARGSRETGHFAILLPSSSRTQSDVWMGLSGVESVRPEHLRDRMSGAVLLAGKPKQATRRYYSLSRDYTQRLLGVILAATSLSGTCVNCDIAVAKEQTTLPGIVLIASR